MTENSIDTFLIRYDEISGDILEMAETGTELHKKVSFEPGEDIYLENQESAFFYIIEIGKVEIWRWNEEKRIRLSTLGPGRIFGESCLIDPTTRRASSTALEKTTCVRISGQKLAELLDHCPVLLRALIKVFALNLKLIELES